MLISMAVMLVTLCLCLFRIQAIDPTGLADQARKGRTATSVLVAERGAILDSSGAPLATTVERYTVSGSPDAVRYYTRDGDEVGADGAAEDLAPLLGVAESELRKRLSDLGDNPDKPKQYTVLAKEITPEVWREVKALKIPGIHREVTLRRNYPSGALAGNVIGFLGTGDNSPAMAGLERVFDETLRGVDGEAQYERGAQGQQIPTAFKAERKSQPGKDIHTTLHRDIQWYAQDQIKQAVTEFEAEWGTIVVQNPKTGALLALAEYPTVDPNDPSGSDAEDRGSRALSNVIEPGSTAKVITAAMALEEGVTDPTGQFTIPYKYTTSNGQRFKDAHKHKDQKLTFAGVMADSSNTGTVMVAEQVDKQTRYDYLTRFGFGQPTGLGFPGESKGILAHPDDWDGRQQYAVMFGQGVSVNALQATSVFSTIANDGVRAPTHWVVHDDDTKGAVNDSATESTQVVSADTAQAVRRMLESVVVEGTGTAAAIEGYRVAGKTGTAQVLEGGSTVGYTSSFIGMAPADNPELVVSVIVQKPTTAHYGGTVAGPAFRSVMQYALHTLRVPPSTDDPDLYPVTWE